ncbi:MAG: DNA polymerase III subunit [Candidatus Omnitrophica bacterium]|nr:DNA polymerase III subunit [Candidatus Omnitrophota bacterium]
MLPIVVEYNVEVLKKFAGLNRSGRLAHAYLFIGPRFVGKKKTALAIAKLLNCEQNIDGAKDIFCGQCPSCLKMQAMGHPDVSLIAPMTEGASIKIEQVRLILEKVKMRSFGGGKKVLIIGEADHLLTEGSNILLKTLEEPSPDTLLFLTATAVENILSTIRSRCHIVRFSPFEKVELEEQLVQNYNESKFSSHFLAFSAEGCLGKALQLRDSQSFDKKNQVINRFVFSEDEEYIKTVTQEDEDVKFLLEVLEGWVRDAVLVKSGIRDQRIINFDRLNDLNGFVKKLTFKELTELYSQVVKTQKMLSENFNVKVALAAIKLSM